MNAQNILNLQTEYRDQIAAIAEAVAAANAVKAAGTEANVEPTKTVAARIKAYASATHEAGADVEDARRALTGLLTTLEMPAGSIKASGNRFAGFRKLLTEKIDIAPLSLADAQKANESDDLKAIKAAKAALNKYAKDNKWTGADWSALLEREGITTTEVEVEADADDAEVEAEARAAA